MENDENENATPTQELPLKPKMHVFFFVFCFGASKMTLEDAGNNIGYDTNKWCQALPSLHDNLKAWYTKIKSNFCGFIWSIHIGHQMPASPLHKSMIFTPKCRFFFQTKSLQNDGWNWVLEVVRLHFYSHRFSLLLYLDDKLQLSRWWQLATQIFFYFHPENWGRFPIWLMFFRWVETTN